MELFAKREVGDGFGKFDVQIIWRDVVIQGKHFYGFREIIKIKGCESVFEDEVGQFWREMVDVKKTVSSQC